jgi:hypothetical protein
MTAALPNLAKVATADLVENIGTGNFKASYINWSRTVHLLREHAAGWQPEIVLAADGGVLHRAPVGAFMMLRFRNGDEVTEAIPQAIMDNRNAAIPFDKITARDITDTHRRGICLAAAMTFGLAYELWAKMPLEKGFAENDTEEPNRHTGVKLDGKYTSITGLEKAIKAFVVQMGTVAAMDEWYVLKNAHADLLAQAERDHPDWWNGWHGQPDGFTPLRRKIELLEAQLAEPEPVE